MPQHAALFVGDGLFARIARTVCSAGVLPRKELYEAWEVARRVRRRFRGGRVVDLACGHALLAHMMLILDNTSETALAVDRVLPPSAQKLQAALQHAWPRLAGRVELVQSATTPALCASDVIVSCHACGVLTDDILGVALAARARVAVLPCCHDDDGCDNGGLGGWMDGALAIDATRAARLRSAKYDVWTQQIPAEITPKNRLLLGAAKASQR